MGKMQRKSFPKKSLNPAKEMLDVIVTDVCGKMPKSSIAGKNYFVTFIDEFTRYSYVYFLKEKSEVPEVLIQFIEMIKTKFGKKPKVIRSDRGGEYVNNKVQTYLKQQGIQIQYTVAYSPQQNGISERRNRTLMEAARTMIFAAKFDNCYWAEAVACANYVQNRMITSSTNKTPYEAWFGEKSFTNDFHEFGNDVYAWIPDERRKKLDKKARKLKFIGYDESSKGYRLTNVDTKEVIIARDVKFLTNDSVINEKESTDAATDSIDEAIEYITDTLECNGDNEEELPVVYEREYHNDIMDHDDSITSEYHDTESSYYETDMSYPEIEQTNDDDYIDRTIIPNPNEALRRSNRQNSGKNTRYDDYACNKVMNSQMDKDPTSYKEAMSRSDKKLWHKAMDEEMKSIHKNKTWELVDLPKDRKAIGSKWVYKVKRDVKGNIIRHKARLVAQGYNQKYGSDYDEVFAPVVRRSN
jgi:transposase InsO family protein